ncbi:MAG: acyloxyacyl hydrolase [Cyclobacteriaceae bacterium]
MSRLFLNQNKFRILLFCFFWILPLWGHPQSKFTDDLSVSFNYHYGFILPEYTNFLYLADAPVRSASFNISKETTGKNSWERLYKFPEYGLSVFYSTLGNDEVHGREIALFPYFNLNIISRKRFDIFNETGIGVSYVTRKFDMTDNYLNIAVGSHLNIHFQLKFGLNYKMPEKKLQLQGGVAFDHFSNSNTREPNLGLNYATVYTGVKYLVGQQTERQMVEDKPHVPGHHWELIYSAGGKHPRALGSKIYFTSSATVEYKCEAFPALHFGLGADLFYDTSTEAEMLTLEMDHHKKSHDFRSGLHVSQELVYNRLSLILQEGVYLLLTDKVEKHVMYNRGIIRYRVSDHFFVHLAMKSHLHILDYPELGLGLRW